MRVKYLIEAYGLIESCANREDNSLLKNIENAIASIQLLGTNNQISLVQKIIERFVQDNGANFTFLLCDLRKDLRKEVGLEEVGHKLLHFRITEKNIKRKNT